MAQISVSAGARLLLRRGVSGFLVGWLASGLLLGATDMQSAPSSAPSSPPGGAEAGTAGPKPASGLSYSNDQVPDKPWSIHVLKIDRCRDDFEFHTTLPKGRSFGLATLADQIKALPAELGQPVAAINGDFWRPSRRYEGDPMGLQILRGELVSAPAPERGCFWVDTNGHPNVSIVVSQLKVIWGDGRMTPLGLNQERADDEAVLFTSVVGLRTDTRGGRELVLERDGTNDWLPLQAGRAYSARVKEVLASGNTPVGSNAMVLSLGPELAARTPAVAAGAVLKIRADTAPTLRGVQTAIGGGPMLVRNGLVGSFKGLQTRHPRTAIGWNDNHIFLVEVDGRQRSLSVGMTFPELAEYMAKLGCKEALNFDGGASSTFWVHGQVMNSPSAGHERPMANALALVQKHKNHNNGSSPPAPSSNP
jgi:hypothetical protein